MHHHFANDHHILSLSGGKDSVFLYHELIKRGYLVDEVMFYDTGMEFKAVYDVQDQIKNDCRQRKILYTKLKPEEDFLYKMFDRPVHGTKNGFHYGYSWCGGRCRWGTTDKMQAMDKYAKSKNAKVYIGIAADEKHRIEKERADYKLMPLVDWEITESMCLAGCYSMGYTWEEIGASPVTGHPDTIKLYEILDRVSCWCCANKNLKELRNIYKYLPNYWMKLEDLQSRTDRPMKGEGQNVFQLKERFDLENEWLKKEKSIRSKAFFQVLKERLEEKEGILIETF